MEESNAQAENRTAAADQQPAYAAAFDEHAAPAVQSPEYEDLSGAGATGVQSHPSLDIVLDVPVTVSLEVGKATMSVGELIRLGQGAVVELDRAVGEPLDVMVNGALVAHGEIVLVNEKFGIRLTSVVSSEGAEREAG